MTGCSIGFPGRMKVSWMWCWYAQTSSARLANSLPLSTVMAWGAPRDLNDRLQGRGHLLATQPPVGHQPQTLPRALIEHGEHAEPAPVDAPLVHDVHRPARVRRAGRRLGPAVPVGGALPGLRPHEHALLRGAPGAPFGVHVPPFPVPENREPAIPEPHAAGREVPQPNPECLLRVAARLGPGPWSDGL